LKRCTTEKIIYFFDQKLEFQILQSTCPYASIKDVQATGEAFSQQKRISSTSTHEIFSLFSIFVGLVWEFGKTLYGGVKGGGRATERQVGRSAYQR
jgi:hypothetical protein